MQQGLDDDLYHRVDEYSEIGAFSEEEKLAAELAERFVFDHGALKTDEAFWERMKLSFSDQQILELLSLIGFCLGVGIMTLAGWRGLGWRVINSACGRQRTFPSGW